MRRSTTLIALLALAAAGLAGSGPAARAAADDSWRPVTIVYEGDVGGKIEPCG